MSTYDKYPKFYDGQILTSKDLNGSFDYLNGQIKKTRKLLFGHGVVNGFNPSTNADCSYIRISKGKAVTKDGTIIDLDEDIVCTFAEKCTEENEKFVLYEHKESDRIGVDLSFFKDTLPNYLIGIAVERGDDDPIHCSEESCSLDSSSVKISYRPFLIKKEQVKTDHKIEKELVMPRLTNIVHSKELAVFLRQITDYYYDNLARIREKMAELPSSETIDFKEVAEKLQDEKFVFNASKAAVYLSFLFDLCKAINEYVGSYNNHISKYRIDYDPIEEMDNVVIIGRIDNSADNYRESYTEYYQDYGRVRSRVILDRMCNRIECIVGCFNPQLVNENMRVFVLPQKKNGLLGERVVPVYYGTSETAIMARFKEFWDAHDFQHSDSLTHDEFYLENNTARNKFHQADSFHINGYSEMHVRDFQPQINRQILEHNLPIQFVRFDLIGKKESFRLEEYKKSDVKWNQQLILDCCEKLLRQGDDLNTAPFVSATKFWDVLHDAYDNNNVGEGSLSLKKMLHDPESLCGNNTVYLEQFRQAVYLLLKNEKEKMEPVQRHFLDFLIRSIVFATEREDCLQPKIRYGAEFTGDVSADNVMVAVCHYNRVVLCLNMNASDYYDVKDDFVVLKEDQGLIDINAIHQCFAISKVLTEDQEETMCNIVLSITSLKDEKKLQSLIQSVFDLTIEKAENIIHTAKAEGAAVIKTERKTEADALVANLNERSSSINPGVTFLSDVRDEGKSKP